MAPVRATRFHGTDPHKRETASMVLAMAVRQSPEVKVALADRQQGIFASMAKQNAS